MLDTVCNVRTMPIEVEWRIPQPCTVTLARSRTPLHQLLVWIKPVSAIVPPVDAATRTASVQPVCVGMAAQQTTVLEVQQAIANLPAVDRRAELRARERELQREKSELTRQQKNEDRKRQRLQDRLRGVGDEELFALLKDRLSPRAKSKAVRVRRAQPVSANAASVAPESPHDSVDHEHTDDHSVGLPSSGACAALRDVSSEHVLAERDSADGRGVDATDEHDVANGREDDDESSSERRGLFS